MRWLAAVVVAALFVVGAVVVLTKSDHNVPLVSRTTGLGAAADKLKVKVKRQREPLPHAACPAGLAGCVRVSGRVLYVETVDPDGDGDLHVILADRSLTIIKVPAGVRPAHNPGVGDGVSAAGQMTTGSSNELELHASVFVEN